MSYKKEHTKGSNENLFPTTNNLRQQVINSKEKDPDSCLSSIVFLAVRSLDRVSLVLEWGKRKKYLHIDSKAMILQLLKSIHFKNTVKRSSFNSKLWPFSIILQLTLFWGQLKWTEDRATMFLNERTLIFKENNGC